MPVLQPNRKFTPVAQIRVWSGGARNIWRYAHVDQQAAALANAQADLRLVPQHLDAFKKRFEFLLAVADNNWLTLLPRTDLCFETVALHPGALHRRK